MITVEEARAKLAEAEQAGSIQRANYYRNKLDMPPISLEGAPFGDRAAVETARGPGAQRQTLENRYPGGGIRPFGSDNFVMPGPQGGEMLFNPPGFEMGDLGFAPRMGAQVAGSLTGGFLGLPGGIPGAMAGAGLGGEIAGQGYDMMMRNAAGTVDTRGTGQKVFDTGMGVAGNSMGGPMFRQPPYDTMIRQADDLLFNRALTDMKMPPLTPGQSGSRLGQRVEGALESTLTGGPAIDRQRGNIETAFRTYIDELYPEQLTREQAGNRAAQGVESVIGARDQVGSKRWTADQLYKKLDELIDGVDGGSISIPKSRELLAQFEAGMARDPEYARLINTDPDLQRYVSTLRKAMEEVPPTTVSVPTGKPRVGSTGVLEQPTVEQVVSPGHAPAFPLYDTLKQFRTNVGQKLNSFFATSTDGGIEAEKRRLYGVLSEDLAAGADELGGVGATQARTRADTYYRTLSDRLALIDPVFKHADNPTRVYEGLSLLVRNNPKALAAAKKTMPADAWTDFTDTYMQQLLAAKPGAENIAGNAVSYHTIATNLSKLRSQSPESYKLLAGDKAPALDNILRLASRFKDSERFFNRSRTATGLNLSGVFGSASTGAGVGAMMGRSPGTAMAGAGVAVTMNTVLPWLTSKVMTSPNIRKAMGKMPTALIGGDITPSVLARSLIAAGANEADVQELMDMENQ